MIFYFTVLKTGFCDVNLQLDVDTAWPVQDQAKAGQPESSNASKLQSAQMMSEERLSRTRSSIYLFPRTYRLMVSSVCYRAATQVAGTSSSSRERWCWLRGCWSSPVPFIFFISIPVWLKDCKNS